MKYAERSKYFLQADEIDHLTIRYTDFGEKLNCKRGVEMIKYYNSAYPSVNDILNLKDASYEYLNSLSETEIYSLLVLVRTELLKLAFI